MSLDNMMAAHNAHMRIRAYLDGNSPYKAWRGEAPEGEPTLKRDLEIVLPVVAQGGARLMSYQDRVRLWVMHVFGAEIAQDTIERGDRFVEEALELVQTIPGFTADRAHALVDYVFGRPVGEPRQELGGVMLCLAALANNLNLVMEGAGEAELERVMDPVMMERIRAKQAAKPTGSALPIAVDHLKQDGYVSALAVLDAEQWEPCAPDWLSRHPGQCGVAPRVWGEAAQNHYHPVNWPGARLDAAEALLTKAISFKADDWKGWSAFKTTVREFLASRDGTSDVTPIDPDHEALAVACARRVKIAEGYRDQPLKGEAVSELDAWIERNRDVWGVLVSTFRKGLPQP